MSFDPFKQSKLMSAYTGMQNSTVPQSEIESIDDLKRLAGVTTSYGEETSEYATNLGQIQREQNIRPGSEEWFKLWFARPHLTGEKPFNEGIQKYTVSTADAEFLIEQHINATSRQRFALHGPNKKLFEHYDLDTATELITEKIVEEERLVTENIAPNDPLLTEFFTAFGNFSTGNTVNPNDSVCVLRLTATKFTGKSITLTGFLDGRVISGIGNGVIYFEDGSMFPETPVLRQQTRTWDQTIVFKDSNHAQQCYTLLLLHLSDNREWEFVDEVS
jgi:hypothetical protein